MVRNPHDGYPYLNLNFFFFLKISWNLNFLVKLIGQGIPDGEGRGLTRDIKKKNQNSTKNVNKIATVHKAGTLLYISAF